MHQSDPESSNWIEDHQTLCILPLGGLDEFGLNCAIVSYGGRFVVVDCGIGFPETRAYGVETFVPDWSAIRNHLDRCDGIIVTHAHEDHVGAVAFLLEEADVPVFGSPYTLRLLARRLTEHEDLSEAELVSTVAEKDYQAGLFTLRFYPVDHSIAQPRAVVVGCADGKILFTGDWKCESRDPAFSETVKTVEKLASEQLLAIYGDSTNAPVSGRSKSERDVAKAFSGVFADSPGRIFITQFSSNMNRLEGILTCCAEAQRPVVVMGRSLEQNLLAAKEEGLMAQELTNLVSHEDGDLEGQNTVVVLTGSQAEPRSALARLGEGTYGRTSLRSGDTVVFSARIIPGSEVAVSRLRNALLKKGVRVITAKDEPIHASGHATGDEIRWMLDQLRPRWVLPSHGEYSMRSRHAEIAEELGLDSIMLYNGDLLQLTPAPKVLAHFPTERVAVDNRKKGTLDNTTYRDRRKLAYAGVIVATYELDEHHHTPRLAAPPTLVERGFLNPNDDWMLDEASHYAAECANTIADSKRGPNAIGEAIRTAVRRYFRRCFDVRPEVILIELDWDE